MLPQCHITGEKVTEQNLCHQLVLGRQQSTQDFKETFASNRISFSFDELNPLKVWSGVRYSSILQCFILATVLVEGAPHRFSETLLGFCPLPKETIISEKQPVYASANLHVAPLNVQVVQKEIEGTLYICQTFGEYEIILPYNQTTTDYRRDFKKMMLSLEESSELLRNLQKNLLSRCFLTTSQ